MCKGRVDDWILQARLIQFQGQVLASTKVFVAIVVLAYFTAAVDDLDVYDLQEFFAGVARITRLGRMSGLTAVACDREYDREAAADGPGTAKRTTTPNGKRRKNKGSRKVKQNNAMDINGNAGFALPCFFQTWFVFPESCWGLVLGWR